MKDDSASYYDSREFTELLTSYENMLADGGSVYFDSMDIANIAEYYSMNGDLDKSDTAIEYGLRLHPSDADILISKGNIFGLEFLTLLIPRQFLHLCAEPFQLILLDLLVPLIL